MFKRPSRVLMTADTVGGVWSYCLELVRSPEWQDVFVYLATMGPALSRSQAREAASLPNLRVFENDCKLEWMDDPWRDVQRSGEWLLELEDRFSPEIIHLNGYAHGALPFQAPKVIVAHSCVLSWWEAVKHESAPAEWNRYRAAVSDGLGGADAVVAPSRAMLDNLNRFYGVVENGRVIHNGCDSRAFAPGKKEPFILSAGRVWDQAKNIAALAAIAHSVPWPVYVAGDNKGPDGKCEANPVVGVNCLGKLSRPELAQWYSRASIYVLPAYYEPFGLSILEAALSGCALVVGGIPSLRELWQDAALFVSPRDPEHLRSVLERLIGDPQELQSLSRAAAKRALDYSAAAMSEKYLELYRSLFQRAAIQTRELATCA